MIKGGFMIIETTATKWTGVGIHRIKKLYSIYINIGKELSSICY